MRAFNVAANEPWLITQAALDQILSIAQRTHEPDFEAVEGKLAKYADRDTQLRLRGSIGIVDITGPIFRHANLFTAISGASALSDIAQAFTAGMERRDVRAIVLNIDSPGGEVAGISEMAQMIATARGVKPVVAYVDGMAASAAYWLASAAERIVTSDTGELGSIGVMGTIVERADGPGVKRYTFVSSQSPKKRPDLESDEGRAQILAVIDDLAAVFVSAVAKNRGVTEEKVLADFGQGWLVVGAKAVAAGMADSVSTFENLVSGMAEQATDRIFQLGGTAANSKTGGTGMPEPNPNPAAGTVPTPTPAPAPAPDLSQVRAGARTEERTRICAILNSPEAEGREPLARHLALVTDMTPEAAIAALKAMPKAAAVPPVNPLDGAMAAVKNPKVGIGDAGSDQETVDATVQRILANSGMKGAK